MPVLIVLTVLIQACFIYHVFKTGRPYWWAFIILSFPAVGCIAYYFVEVFPGSREHRAARRAANNVSRALNPDRELKRLQEAVEISPTVANKATLAEELASCGQCEEAIELYADCMAGMYADDPRLLFGLAHAHLLKQDHERVRTLLDELKAKCPDFVPNEVALLYAQALEGLGDTRGALLIYEKLIEIYVGLEARVRYGLLLKKLGHLKQANSVFEDLLTHARRFNVSLEQERKWIELARQSIVQL
jgi:hypothetical protein